MKDKFGNIILDCDQIDHAISNHEIWKIHLKQAIDGGVFETPSSIVRMDNQCEFGKWIYSLSTDAGIDPHYIAVKELHAQFHQSAALILELINGSRKDEARKSLNVGGEFNFISSKLILALIDWKESIKNKGLSVKENKELSSINFQKINVLVVNGNYVTRSLLKASLERLGCDVDFALNGVDAVEHMQKNVHKYHLCLMDLQMPIMGGEDSVRIIRELIDKNIPIIGLTASEDQKDKEEALKAGMNDYIISPFNAQSLNDKIKQWVK